MTTPYPPAPKRLLRSPSNKMIGGVCSGVANYLNMDVTLVRILTVVLTLFTGVPVILYLVALFLVPEEGADAGPPSYPPVGPPTTYAPTDYSGYSPTPPPAAADPVWGNSGAPWEQAPGQRPVDPERRPEA